MRQILKIALSLLVSVLAAGAVLLGGQLGLFELVQRQFFQPALLSRQGDRLVEIAQEGIEQYHLAYLQDRFAEVVTKPFVLTAANPNPSRQENFERENYFGRLREQYPGLQAVRIVRAGGGALDYSTLAADYQQEATRRIYRPPDRLEDRVDPAWLAPDEKAAARMVADSPRARFVYSLPVVGGDGQLRGTALFYVAQDDLLQALLRRPDWDVRAVRLIGGVDPPFVLINPPEAPSERVDQAVKEALSGPAVSGQWASGPVSVTTERGEVQEFRLLYAQSGEFGSVGLLLSASLYELHPAMQGVLLAAVFLTVFLVALLILNLRQDPVLVLTQRIKRLQLTVLQEFIEGKQEADWKRWRNELVASRAALSSRIKKGVGRVSADREAELDAMIDRSWDEIIGIIEARVGARRETVDVSQVEQLIQKALDRGQISVQAGSPGPGRAPARPAGLVVEEIGVDEVVEPGRIVEAEEAVDEVEPAGEAVEEVEEAEAVEEVEEAEAVEEVEAVEEAVGEAEEPGALEEIAAVEEVEEAEAVEEVEEVEEAEAVEEVEEAEAVEEAAGEVQPAEAAVGEAEEAEALEEIAAVEEVEEAEALEEAVEEAEAVEEVAEAQALEPAEEAAPVQEDLEELSTVKELVPLAPLPQEELEELPEAAEEGPSAKLPAAPVAGRPAPAAARPAPAATRVAAGPAEAFEELAAAEELSPVEALLAGEEELEIEEPAGGSTRPLSAEEIERLQRAEEEKQLADLEKTGVIQCFSLAELERLVMEQRTSVVLEDGVYQIKEEVIGGRAGKRHGRRRGLKAVAEAVLAAEDKPAGAETGIGSLLGEELLMDLAGEVAADRESPEEEVARGGAKARKIRLFENGIDYDGYLEGFRRGKTETDRLRSLVDLTRSLRAVNAGIFVAAGGRFEARLKVGLLDHAGALAFSAQEPVGARYLQPRKAVVVAGSLEKVTALARHFHPDDLKYMQGALFLPVVYQGANAVLFLGLPVKKRWSMAEIITSLNIY